MCGLTHTDWLFTSTIAVVANNVSSVGFCFMMTITLLCCCRFSDTVTFGMTASFFSLMRYCNMNQTKCSKQSHYIMKLQIIWLKVNWASSGLKWLSPELAGPDYADVCQHTCYLGWLDVVLLLECRPCFVWVHLVVNVCGKWAAIRVYWNYAQLCFKPVISEFGFYT